MAYWYNVDSGQVEQDGATQPKGNLMGPYDTQEQAQQALESAARRTKEWDDDDRAWNDGDGAR